MLAFLHHQEEQLGSTKCLPRVWTILCRQPAQCSSYEKKRENSEKEGFLRNFIWFWNLLSKLWVEIVNYWALWVKWEWVALSFYLQDHWRNSSGYWESLLLKFCVSSWSHWLCRWDTSRPGFLCCLLPLYEFWVVSEELEVWGFN